MNFYIEVNLKILAISKRLIILLCDIHIMHLLHITSLYIYRNYACILCYHFLAKTIMSQF